MDRHASLLSGAFGISDDSILHEILSFLGPFLVFLLPLWPILSPLQDLPLLPEFYIFFFYLNSKYWLVFSRALSWARVFALYVLP